MTPRVPKALWSSLGPLPVVVTSNIPEDAMGMFTYRPRTITLDKTNGPAAMWGTFWHEATHVALWDSGIHNGLTHELEEAICDAVGTFLAGMTLAGNLTVRAPKD